MAYTKTRGKRLAQTQKGPLKKRRLATPKPHGTGKHKSSKTKASSDRDIIPIPVPDHDEQLSDQDLNVLDAYGDAASFLNRLDHRGIARSKKESDRLHRLNKPVPKPRHVDNLPSIDSHDEDEASWSSNVDEESSSSSESSEADSVSSSDNAPDMPNDLDSDTEMLYEAVPRKRRLSWDRNQDSGIPRLPIKLPDGRVQKVDIDIPRALTQVESVISEEGEASGSKERMESKIVEDISTGARFGRPAVIDVIGKSSRKARIQESKEEIASICQATIAEPENSLGLLRRLHTFSLPKISTSSHPDPVVNDPIIRRLAILSQLAVFKDIIPGYRIRPLTDAERAEKVSQQVARTREWEQGLVVVYQTYLRSLESELKAKSELAEVSLRCICTLAVEIAHFNFSVNLMSSIIAHLSRKSWDKSSEHCLETIVQVFRSDLTGKSSLETVRLLNRMIKEKRYNVHPNVLSCLVHLRLKTELKTRTSDTKTDKAMAKSFSKGRAAARRAKGKATDQPYASKKARKAMKEQKGINQELREAEAEVDKEERDACQTETLKLIFVLYFRILKNPNPTPLLPAALQGISKFAHLVSIDFFEDLMKVLKHLISRDSESFPENPKDGKDVQYRLLCIVTAFELLSGQGEALNIDLTDFLAELYAIILPLSLMCNIDSQHSETTDLGDENPHSGVATLFRALTIAFSPQSFGTSSPSWRSAAFAKRILLSSLQWPPEFALQAIDFVAGLIAKDPKLETLLNTEERTCDGHFRADIDDPQLCNPFGTSFWELHILQRHWHPKVREAGHKLARFTRS